MLSKDLMSSLRKGFQRFRQTPWFRVAYLILLGLVAAQLYLLTASAVACLVVLLMPVSVFVVPYWLGERKIRRFAINGLPVFLIAILVAGAMSTQALLSQNEAVPIRSFADFQSSPTMALSNGTVTPYHAAPSTPFTFSVKLTTTVDGAPADFLVYLNLTIVTGLTSFDRQPTLMAPLVGSDNTKNGTRYETSLSLADSIYGYGFAVWDRDRNWTSAGPDFGPLTASGWTYYGFFVYVTAFSMVLPFLFYYMIVFLWWYTSRARAARTRMLGGEGGPPKETLKGLSKPKPESTSKVAKAAAFTCTNCGADVTEADDKCPKCGAVFED